LAGWSATTLLNIAAAFCRFGVFLQKLGDACKGVNLIFYLGEAVALMS